MWMLMEMEFLTNIKWWWWWWQCVMIWEVTKRQICQEGDSSEGSSWSSRHLIIRFNGHDEDDTVDEDNNDDDHDHEGVKDSDCLGSKQLLIRRLNWKKMMMLTLRIKRMESLIDDNYYFWMRHKYKFLDSGACIGDWWRKITTLMIFGEEKSLNKQYQEGT